MKKKISIILLTILLVAVVTTSLAGCNLLEMFSESDFEYDSEKVEASVAAMTASGYKITIRYLQTGTENGEKPSIESSGFSIAADGELWYCEQDDDTTYMDFSDDVNYVVYEKKEGEEKWTKTTIAYADMGSKDTVKSLYIDTYLATFTNYGVITAGLKKKGEVTIAGRACTKYVASAAFMGMSYNNEYCVDDETGLCLKNMIAVGSTTEGSGSTSYECTEFIVPYTITLPADSDCIDGNAQEEPQE